MAIRVHPILSTKCHEQPAPPQHPRVTRSLCFFASSALHPLYPQKKLCCWLIPSQVPLPHHSRGNLVDLVQLRFHRTRWPKTTQTVPMSEGHPPPGWVCPRLPRPHYHGHYVPLHFGCPLKKKHTHIFPLSLPFAIDWLLLNCCSQNLQDRDVGRTRLCACSFSGSYKTEHRTVAFTVIELLSPKDSGG